MRKEDMEQEITLGLEPEEARVQAGAGAPEQAAAEMTTTPSGQAMAMAAGVPSKAGNDMTPPDDVTTYMESPFFLGQNSREHINLANGALEYTSADIALPGRNGFDLVINRLYDSSSAARQQIQMEKKREELKYWYIYPNGTNPTNNITEWYGYYGGGSSSRTAADDLARAMEFWEGAQNKQRGSTTSAKVYYYVTGTRENTYLNSLYGLGYGWSFGFPSVEYVSAKESGAKSYETLHLGDGRSFKIASDATSEFTSNLVKYDLLDIRIQREDWLYNLYYKDGRRDKFDLTGKLTSRWDRFGNKITFTYTAEGRLSTITDTMGRVLELVASGSTLQWKRKDTGAVLYTYTVSGNKLTAAADAAGRKTTFAYTEQNALVVAGQTLNEKGANLTYVNLTKITHPTGAESQYTYTRLTEDTSPTTTDPRDRLESLRNFYAVTSRKDIQSAQVMNEGKYAYAMLYEDKQGNKTTGAAGKHLYQVTHTAPSGLVTLHFFNKDGLRTKEQVKNGGTVIRETDYTYQNKLVTKEVEKTTSTSGSFTKTTNWTYSGDKKANVTKITESYSSANNRERTYAYDDVSSLLTEATVKQSGSVTVIERYTLNNSVTVPLWKRVYEKRGSAETLKEQTRFEYDSKYRLIKEHRYYGDLAKANQYHTTTFTYADSGDSRFGPEPVRRELAGLKNPDGSAAPSPNGAGVLRESFVYDWFGRLVQKTDPMNGVTKYAYDSLGRLTKETLPAVNGKTYTKALAYNDSKNQITETNENGIQRRYDYSPLGQVTQVNTLNPETKLRAFTYDKCGRKVTDTTFAPGGGARLTTTYTYDVLNRVLTCKAAGSGVSMSETYVYTDAYQSKYYRVEKTVAGDGNAPAVKVATCANQLEKIYRTETAKGTLTAEYDLLGNCTKQTDPRGKATTMEYDYAGRMTLEKNPLGQTRKFTYDSLGNQSTIVDYAGNDATFTYDAAGRLLEQATPFYGWEKARTRYWYDMNGNVTRTDVLCSGTAGWRTTLHTYDALGRLTQTTLADGVAGVYEYDGVGNRTAVYAGVKNGDLQAAQKTAYEYDRFGHVTRFTDAAGYSERCEYDTTGLLLRKYDRNGAVIEYTHDALGRLTGESVTVNNPRGSVTSSRSIAYTATGKKAREESGDGVTVTYTYDNAGFLIKQQESGGVSKEYAYDAAGNRTGFKLLRSGAEIDLWYGYDDGNRMTQVRKGGSSGEVVARYGYDAGGNRSLLEYPAAGVSTLYDYNDANQVLIMRNMGRNQVLSAWMHTYAPDGNLLEKSDVDNVKTSYSYDPVGRLIREQEGNTFTAVYTYDAFGNRSRMEVSGTRSYTTTYRYHVNSWLLREETTEKRSGGRVISETTRYRYDKNGSQVYMETQRKETGVRYPGPGMAAFTTAKTKEEVALLELREYNGFGQAVTVIRDGEKTDYAYRPDGLRHSKTTNGKTTLHLWDGEQIVMDVVGGSATARYLRGLNLLAREQDGALQYYLFNAHGDVTGRCDGWGNLLKAYRYDAFGVEVEPEKLDANPFRYCGEYFDRETETVYLRSRDYNSATGRFLSEDSVHSSANTLPNEREVIDPLSLNRYTYCHNNPVKYHDPSGNSVSILIPLIIKYGIPALLLLYVVVQALVYEGMKGNLRLPGTSLMPPDYTRSQETFPMPEERQDTAIVEPPLTPKAGPYNELFPNQDKNLSDMSKPAIFPDNGPIIRNGHIVQQTFVHGELYESTITLPDGTLVQGAAEIEINGKILTLKDIAVYSDAGDIKNQAGNLTIRRWIRGVRQQATEQGFEKLIISGKRAQNSTSAKPGKDVYHEYDLRK